LATLPGGKKSLPPLKKGRPGRMFERKNVHEGGKKEIGLSKGIEEKHACHIGLEEEKGSQIIKKEDS